MILTVLIPTHGRPTLLGRTLASLGTCRLPTGYAEAVVVENGSRAGAEAVVAEAAEAHPHLGLRYMHVARANKSHALNEALKTVGEGLVVFFDDDVRLEAGVLAAYAAAAAAHPARAFFGGPMVSDFEQTPPGWLLALLPYSVRGFSMEDARRTGYFLGANWAAYVQELKSLGGFDPDFGPGSPTGARGQEKNMQLRMGRAGLEAIEVSEATVHHYVPLERCSPEWAVRRTYQTGAQQGRLASTDERRDLLIRTLSKVPRGALAVAKRAALRDVKGRHLSLGALAKDIGFIRGYLQHRFGPSPQSSGSKETREGG